MIECKVCANIYSDKRDRCPSCGSSVQKPLRRAVGAESVEQNQSHGIVHFKQFATDRTGVGIDWKDDLKVGRKRK